ncbi:hypothetical protein LIER_08858 [Lithospermum erythrorhizon]|uniref:Uncharacterized protein n=1 Tax=Lithospermum erythrorhizon TaxID=34254 RepID=A0AAV3PFJ3_LITER
MMKLNGFTNELYKRLHQKQKNEEGNKIKDGPFVDPKAARVAGSRLVTEESLENMLLQLEDHVRGQHELDKKLEARRES